MRNKVSIIAGFTVVAACALPPPCSNAPPGSPSAAQSAEPVTGNINLKPGFNLHSCVGVRGGWKTDGANIEEIGCSSSDPAMLFRAEDIGGGAVRFVNAMPGNRCLDAAHGGRADGDNVQLWTCDSTRAQSFRIVDAGNGDVYVINTASGKCLDVERAEPADGTNIQLWTCNGSKGQRWQRQRGSNSNY